MDKSYRSETHCSASLATLKLRYLIRYWMLPVLAGPRSLRRIFRAVTSVYVIGSASDARCRVRCKKNDRWHITNILVGRRSALASGPKTLQQWPSLRLQSSFVATSSLCRFQDHEHRQIPAPPSPIKFPVSY